MNKKLLLGIIAIAVTGAAIVGSLLLQRPQTPSSQTHNEQHPAGQQATKDTTPPTVQLSITQAALDQAKTKKLLAVAVAAHDNVAVSKVVYYLDNKPVATTGSPFTTNLDIAALANGGHTIVARAYDSAANVGASDVFSFTLSADSTVKPADSHSQAQVQNSTPGGQTGGGTTTPPPTGGGGGTTPPPASSWPDASNTGVPAGTTLHTCNPNITVTATYDACQFNGDVTVHANNVVISRSLILGHVEAGSGSLQSGLVISDSTIDCGCMSVGANDTPSAISESNYTLLRVNIMHSGHGAAVKNNVVIKDSYIHNLGGNTDAHKDGIYSGDGSNVTIDHNNIECNDGPRAGCTSAIGLLTDFSNITNWTINNNLLNTIGSYCFYGEGGPSKPYHSNHIAFTNNHFGRKDNASCGFYGPVTYFNVNAAGNVWSGNVWDDTGATVPADY